VNRFWKRWLPLCGLLFILVALTGCGSTPQLGDNEDANTAADALWTAVLSRRQPLVEKSAAEIERLHKSGDLNEDAYAHLSRIVADARAEEWEDAVAGLRTLLKGQRRGK
jgi:hypothetical protein